MTPLTGLKIVPEIRDARSELELLSATEIADMIELPEAPSLEGGCTLYRDGATIFSTPAPAIDWGAQLEAASRFTYIRSGDLLAVELAARAPLTRREETPVRITGPSIDFRIIG